jgi:hypothetical protein
MAVEEEEMAGAAMAAAVVVEVVAGGAASIDVWAGAIMGGVKTEETKVKLAVLVKVS